MLKGQGYFSDLIISSGFNIQVINGFVGNSLIFVPILLIILYSSDQGLFITE